MNDTIETLRARVSELEANAATMKAYYEQVFADGGSRISELKDQLAAQALTIKTMREMVDFLWSIIDDIDTYSDMAKSDDNLFRTLVEKRQAARWKTGITTDGYSLNIPTLALPDNSTEVLQEWLDKQLGEPVAWRFTAPGITKLDSWPHGGKWHPLYRKPKEIK